MGQIYVYGRTDPDKQQFFKIGYTKLTSSTRGKTYRKDTSSPHKNDITFLFSVYGDVNLETKIHEHWSDQCKNGEWFYATDIRLRGWVRWVYHRTFANHDEFNANVIRVASDRWFPNDGRSAPVAPPFIGKQLGFTADKLCIGPWDDIIAKPPITENDWYTPSPIIDAARRVLGAIDTDPASNPEGNEYICAKTIYTVEDNGLTKPWHGNVWCNPPFAPGDTVKLFIEKALDEYFSKKNTKQLLMLLPSRKVSAKYCHALLRSVDAYCFLFGRVSFEGKLADKNGASNAKDGTMIYYLGPNARRFHAVFSEIGTVGTSWGGDRIHRFGGNADWAKAVPSWDVGND